MIAAATTEQAMIGSMSQPPATTISNIEYPAASERWPHYNARCCGVPGDDSENVRQ